jgi:hypothetical protein
MEIVNYSVEPIGKLYGWLPHDLKAEKLYFSQMQAIGNHLYQQEQLCN